MEPDPSYYDLLGVDRRAGNTALREAYRQQVLRNHPDNGGNRAVFAIIEKAYSVLSNPRSRAEYDDELDATPARGNVLPFQALRRADANESGRLDEATRVHEVIDLTSDEPSQAEEDPAAERGRQFFSSYNESETGAPNAATGDTSATSANSPTRRMPSINSLKRVFFLALTAWVLFCLFTPTSIFPGITDEQALFTLFWIGVAWVTLSFALRVGAWFIAIFSLVMALFGDATGTDTAIRVAFAFALWLVGQWVYTRRHGYWKSVVAHQLLTRLPDPLRPDRAAVRRDLAY